MDFVPANNMGPSSFNSGPIEHPEKPLKTLQPMLRRQKPLRAIIGTVGKKPIGQNQVIGQSMKKELKRDERAGI
jgi:hypothetical protein